MIRQRRKGTNTKTEKDEELAAQSTAATSQHTKTQECKVQNKDDTTKTEKDKDFAAAVREGELTPSQKIIPHVFNIM